MSSQIVNQNRIERISWSYNSNSTDTLRQRIIVPFLVDEIRVVSIGAQATALSTTIIANDDIFGRSINVISPDLLGGSGSYLGTARVSLADRFAAGVTIATSPALFSTQPIRYVFPPSAKRNINGTYTFIAQTLFGEQLPDNVRINNFDFLLAIEFIQYKEAEKLQSEVDDDLRVLGKSGRRRL